MSLPLIMLGAGGHAKVLIDALRTAGVAVNGLTDADPAKAGTHILGVPVLGDDEEVLSFAPEAVRLVNGIGSVRIPYLRRRLFDDFRKSGYAFAQVVHPRAIVAGDVVLAEGVQVMAGAVLQTGSRIGENAIINTRAVVDHDCVIGSHVHISPGAVLCGGVVIGDASHIGAGATLIQGVRIGANCMVAAGAVVIRDVPDGMTVMGVPAKEALKQR
jgi:UDP-perosamine 4-acetyltransferase